MSLIDNKTKRRRVLNLIYRQLRTGAARKTRKRYVICKLLDWQPLAHHIRFEGNCHCKNGLLISFRLPFEKPNPRAGVEYCGYYCAACGFSNAGTRTVWTRKHG